MLAWAALLLPLSAASSPEILLLRMAAAESEMSAADTLLARLFESVLLRGGGDGDEGISEEDLLLDDDFTVELGALASTPSTVGTGATVRLSNVVARLSLLAMTRSCALRTCERTHSLHQAFFALTVVSAPQ